MPASSKEFLDIQASIEFGFTLKRLRDMTRTYSQMHCTSKNSGHRSIIWPFRPNGSVFVYELIGSGFESSCSQLNFRFSVCFEQGVFLYPGNYRVWIHSETRAWHDKNIQSEHGSLVHFLHLINSSLVMAEFFISHIIRNYTNKRN